MREEKRSEIIQDALQYLDDDMIENAEKVRGERLRAKRYWRRGLALAASVAIFLAGGWIWNNVVYISPDRFTELESDRNEEQEAEVGPEHNLQQNAENSDVGDLSNKTEYESDNIENRVESLLQEGVQIPEMKVVLKNDAADMIGFFIYKGRCYVQSCEYYQEDISFLGEKLGTATGLIDEWTEKDGYVEFAGSACGDFYEVKGVDPEFMLGLVYSGSEERIVDLYIHNNGITLNKGADLLVDRLHLPEHYKEVSFLTDAQFDKAWSEGKSVDIKTNPLDAEHEEVLEQFITSYCEGEFVKANFNGGDGSNDHIYHLYFTLDSGVRLHFTLLGDGYVSLEGLHQVCVKVDREVYDQLVQILRAAS